MVSFLFSVQFTVGRKVVETLREWEGRVGGREREGKKKRGDQSSSQPKGRSGRL